MSKIYDVIVLGAGPAGLAAGLYAGRSRLSVLIIEKGQDGGQIAITDEIENYPGQTVEGESGPSLIARMTEQAAKFGAERVSDTITEVSLEGEVKVLKSAKAEYQGKNVIIATGAHARPIGCKGEAEYMRILSNAYNNQEKADFYLFLRALDAAKATMRGENKTLIIDETSPLADIFYGY